jgi:hypothetical protein
MDQASGSSVARTKTSVRFDGTIFLVRLFPAKRSRDSCLMLSWKFGKRCFLSLRSNMSLHLLSHDTRNLGFISRKNFFLFLSFFLSLGFSFVFSSFFSLEKTLARNLHLGFVTLPRLPYQPSEGSCRQEISDSFQYSEIKKQILLRTVRSFQNNI